jgi:hypothetical protein
MTCILFDPKHTPARHAPSGKDLATHDYHDLIDPKRPIPFNHNPHYYVKDEVLKTGVHRCPPGEFLKIGSDESEFPLPPSGVPPIPSPPDLSITEPGLSPTC